MIRTLTGWLYPSNQKQIREARTRDEDSDLIYDLQNNPSYRKLLFRYAKRNYKSSPSTWRRLNRLLARHPCLVGPQPRPEVEEGTRIYFPWVGVPRGDIFDHGQVPWWKHRRHKNIGKGKVKYDERIQDE